MFKRLAMKTALVFTAFLSLFLAPALGAGTGGAMLAKATDQDPAGTNVRDSPGGKIIYTIPQRPADSAERGKILIHHNEGRWFSVLLTNGKGTSGWMHGSVLGPANWSINGAPCPLRRSPAENSPIAAVPAEGAELQLLDLRYPGNSETPWVGQSPYP